MDKDKLFSKVGHECKLMIENKFNESNTGHYTRNKYWDT